jgi:hypothetical protein
LVGKGFAGHAFVYFVGFEGKSANLIEIGMPIRWINCFDGSQLAK